MGARGGGAALALSLLLAACGGTRESASPPRSAAPNVIRVRSAFPDGGTIPRTYTCDGTRRPPALSWTGVPARARELVLVVEDPDAPGGTYVHWTAFGIPPSASTVPAHVAAGKSSAGGEGWTPPCPPQGDRPHRYVFTVYALGRRSGLHAGAGAGAVRSAIASSAIARGRLVGRYGR